MARHAGRGSSWLLVFGMLAAAYLIYLGVSLTSPAPPQESFPPALSTSSPLRFVGWDESAWRDAALRPTLVLLLVSDSLSPRGLELEGLLQNEAAIRSVMASHFLPMRVDRRTRPDLALRYSENLIPHLSVLLPSGEALARITGEPESWSKQFVETDRYWRDHKSEIQDRVDAFWAELESDSMSQKPQRPQPSDIEMIDSAVFGFLDTLLHTEKPGAALWRTDFDRYLLAHHSDRADSVWRALASIRARHSSDLGRSPLPEVTPAEWAGTIAELRLYGGSETNDSVLVGVQQWFARRGGPVTAEEAACIQRLTFLLKLELRPSYPGLWLGFDSASTTSLPHLRQGLSALDGYLVDAAAWLETCVESDDHHLLENAMRLGDSLWSRLWDPARQAFSDKPAVSNWPRETKEYPRAQLGRLACLFDRLSALTEEARFKARADSCLAGFAPFVREAGTAATYYGEALLLRSQPADQGGPPAAVISPRSAGTP